MESKISVKEGRRKFVYVYKDGGIVINGYKLSKQEPDVVIPEQIGNRKVIEIGNSAFEKDASIRSLVFLGGVKKIGFRAFFGCIHLELITFPETLEEIYGQAFYDCKNLRDYKFPEQLRLIGGAAFFGCASLCKIVFPESVEIIEANSFERCTNLEEAVLPSNLKKIGGWAFADCSSLKKVHFSGDISKQSVLDMKIGNHVFRNDTLLANSDGHIHLAGILFGYIGKSMDCFEYPEQYIRVVNVFDFSNIVYRKNECQEIDFAEWKFKDKGDTVLFGRFPQDSSFLLKPIEWRVLSREEDELLLISEKALMHLNYDEKTKAVTWMDCMLRKWLNGPFYQFAFDEKEKNRVKTTLVHAVTLAFESKSGLEEKVTGEDYVTVLTAKEAEKYFDTQLERICYPTKYTEKLMNGWAGTLGSFGYDTSSFEKVWWWLRNEIAIERYRVPSVSDTGFVRSWVSSCDYVKDKATTVRPVIRVRIQ